jgi:hypothetical protein
MQTKAFGSDFPFDFFQHVGRQTSGSVVRKSMHIIIVEKDMRQSHQKALYPRSKRQIRSPQTDLPRPTQRLPAASAAETRPRQLHLPSSVSLDVGLRLRLRLPPPRPHHRRAERARFRKGRRWRPAGHDSKVKAHQPGLDSYDCV